MLCADANLECLIESLPRIEPQQLVDVSSQIRGTLIFTHQSEVSNSHLEPRCSLVGFCYGLIRSVEEIPIFDGNNSFGWLAYIKRYFWRNCFVENDIIDLVTLNGSTMKSQDNLFWIGMSLNNVWLLSLDISG